ncbi:hypothetical protein ERJ75_000549500 [Trypanosoma vivax]|nr:hypothetical protein ERJ75_000549500 [Trypanosoma vivax]
MEMARWWASSSCSCGSSNAVPEDEPGTCVNIATKMEAKNGSSTSACFCRAVRKSRFEGRCTSIEEATLSEGAWREIGTRRYASQQPRRPKLLCRNWLVLCDQRPGACWAHPASPFVQCVVFGRFCGHGAIERLREPNSRKSCAPAELKKRKTPWQAGMPEEVLLEKQRCLFREW